jgi:tetratricopeptide (TPR) repeat protein
MEVHMITSKKIGTVGMVLFLSLALSCATGPAGSSYSNYREGMFQGYGFLQNGQYPAAIQQFLRATRGDPTSAWPMALAGQASYQMGNYAQASQYLTQAASLVKADDYAYLVIKGYQSLIAFRDNKQEEGMAALAEYVRVYRFSYPDKTYYEVKRMYDSGKVEVAALEDLINADMSRYESEGMQWGWMLQD